MGKMAKEADLLPYIDAKTLRDVKIDAKDRLKFDVPIFGEPAPEVSWYNGDDLIENDKSITITNLEGHTKIGWATPSRWSATTSAWQTPAWTAQSGVCESLSRRRQRKV